jgi:hypothetical protein
MFSFPSYLSFCPSHYPNRGKAQEKGNTNEIEREERKDIDNNRKRKRKRKRGLTMAN